MKLFSEFLEDLGLPATPQPASEPIAAEVSADLRKFLVKRRSYTDAWFFLLRLLIGLCVLGYLWLELLLGLPVHTKVIYWTSGYVAVNILLRLAINRGFLYARWAYAGIDFFAILLLRHYVQLDILLDLNATMIGFFSLLLIAYVHYSDIRLTSVMVVAVLVVTVLTLWVNVLYWPQESPQLANVAAYYAHPLPALLLLSYLGIVSVLTHRLVHRLYAQLLRYSQEQYKRTRAAVVSAVERSKRERLEELNRLKHNFITVISHELRNPITPLVTSLTILENEMNGAVEGREMLRLAQESAGRIQRIVTDYTKLAELITMEDEGLLRWNIRLDDLMQLLQERASKQPQIMGSFDDLVVCSDPRLLGGALLALMRRAELLTPPDAAVTLRGYRDNDGVVMSIHDPASFLEEQAIASLDDPFALTDERAFSQQPNTGLELILARHSLRRMGGELEIESRPNAGTTVHCILPGQQPGARWLSDAELRREVNAA